MKSKLTILLFAILACTNMLFAQGGTCGQNLTWKISDGVLVISGTGPMTNYSQNKTRPWTEYTFNSVVVSEGVTTIGDYAFYFCSTLSSVTIANSVTSIGECAFRTTGLTEVLLPNSVISVGYRAFFNIPCTSPIYNTHIFAYLPKSYEGVYVIPEGIEIIAGGAFSGSNLTSVTIPNSVIEIGQEAFRACSSLNSLMIPNNVTKIGGMAFAYCVNLSSVTMSHNVTDFGEDPFLNCTNLPVINNLRYADSFLVEVVDKNSSTYILRQGTTWIGSNAFKDCNNLTNIVLPDSVIGIGSNAFQNCNSLQSISIPSKVISLGNNVFSVCISLTSVIIEGENPPRFGYDIFSECLNLDSIFVPCGTLETYKNAWWNYQDLLQYAPLPYTITIIPSDYGYVISPTSKCDSQILAIPNNGYYFTQWSDGSIDNPRTITLTQDTTFDAEFAAIPCEPQILHDTTVTCQGEKVPWLPLTIPTDIPGSYDYYDSLKNIMGCDSILHYHVIVHSSYEFPYDTTVYVGDEVMWHNGYVKAEKAGTYRYVDTLKTCFGCDSVFVLNLYVKPKTQKMCSWLVESNDLVMGAVITSFDEPLYKYGTQITVEASPNSGYKFVKWNDGKKFNPYKFSLLDDKYLLAIFMEEQEEQDTTTVLPSATTATFIWPFIVGGFSYSLTIYLDFACTIPFCTITFNQYGQFIGISFGNRAPRRYAEQEDGFTYTVSGLDANTEYYFKMETMDEDNKLINTDEGSFRTQNGATAIEYQQSDMVSPYKVMINGQILILRGDKTYTVTGQEVK